MSDLLISRFVPERALRDVEHLAVAAAPERAWQVARDLDLVGGPFSRALFEARVLPERISALLRRGNQPAARSMNVCAVEDQKQPGFLLLAEEPGREVVTGAVGRFWNPRIEWAAVSPETFAAFDEPGWGKVAFNIRVDAREAGGTWITIELRGSATDPASLERFRRSWVLAGPFSRAIRRPALRRAIRELGIAPRAALAGDDLLPRAKYQRTHRAFIEVPPEKVWPWLVQMGCGRAGWYSYDLLDNGGVKSATSILPQIQKLEVGDIIPASPRGRSGFGVLRVERGRSLVLGSPRLLPDGSPSDLPWPAYDATWAFQLEPIGTHATLLIVRCRATYEPTIRNLALRLLVGAAHEIMQPEQLRNLKARAEGYA